MAAGEKSLFMINFVWVFGQNCDLILLDIGDICGFLFLDLFFNFSFQINAVVLT